ncbi:hypothetical protein CVT25_013483 [Psilocybe cyanescens]|uniref:Uncharacterized protein n=1 Tax=Psilocybe cyanescens TaxID=93625 RepID=A0A409WTS1_PSICY|nr:hypothetical protein CVT25_013483 [Psilocybe cyanescens]
MAMMQKTLGDKTRLPHPPMTNSTPIRHFRTCLKTNYNTKHLSDKANHSTDDCDEHPTGRQ